MPRDRYRRWGINDKNRKGPVKSRHSLVTATHENDVRRRQDQAPDGSTAHYLPAASRSLQLPFNIPKRVRLLQQALKSVHDWQHHFSDLGERAAIIPSAIWLRTQLRSMRWAVHCLENKPSLDQSNLAFRRLQEASIILHNNLAVRCTPPAVLMSMFTLLKFNSLDSRPSSVYYYTARRFFLQMAAEMLPATHPTLLMLQLFLCEQTPEMMAAVYRVGRSVIGQCLGTTSQEIWTSQVDLTDAATTTDMEHNSQGRSTETADKDLTADDVHIAEPAMNRKLAYVHRLHLLSESIAQRNENLREAYGAYQLLAASQNWLNDSAGEEVLLQNALKLANAMEPDADVGSGEPSLELQQAVRELYCYYEGHDDVGRREALRLEYPRPFREWDIEVQ